MFPAAPKSNGKRSMLQTVDWWLILGYLALVLFGWVNIYASVHGEEPASIFDLGFRCGKQFLWILTSLGFAGIILFFIPPRAYPPVSTLFYMLTLLLLVLVIFLGRDINGSRSWFTLGSISFQPAEISKIATSLMLASFMSHSNYRMKGKQLWITLGIILLPMLIIMAEKETGSALVYIGFVFMLYREGFSGWIITILGLVIMLFILTITISSFASIFVLLALISFFDMVGTREFKWWLAIILPALAGILFVPEAYRDLSLTGGCIIYVLWSAWRAFRKNKNRFRWYTIIVLLTGMALSFSAGFIFNNVLKDYQKNRIEILLAMKEDLSGVGYNVHQSKIAIGSGGLLGKGFCQGTQTAFGFVPEQSTDFIFCTVGEEWGFLGCLGVIAVYFLIIMRIIIDSEHSREAFNRIFGYCLASCLFMHLFINVGMTLGIMPVIGIPLPFMSYGGSSLWAFTVMLFIFIRLDINERKYF